MRAGTQGHSLPADLSVPGLSLPKQHRALQAPLAASFHDPCLLPDMVVKHRLASWLFCKLPRGRKKQPWAGRCWGQDRPGFCFPVNLILDPIWNGENELNWGGEWPWSIPVYWRGLRVAEVGWEWGGTQSQGLIVPGAIPQIGKMFSVPKCWHPEFTFRHTCAHTWRHLFCTRSSLLDRSCLLEKSLQKLWVPLYSALCI